jgi:hypothetical protein
MIILRLDKDNIETIADNFISQKTSQKLFIEGFQGDVEKHDLSGGWEKYIIRNVSNSINTIVLDCINSRFTSIAFFGDFQISFNDLVSIYKKYRRFYSHHDDVTQFFFNENSSKGTYVIMCNVDGIVNEDDDSWKSKFLKSIIISLT